MLAALTLLALFAGAHASVEEPTCSSTRLGQVTEKVRNLKAVVPPGHEKYVLTLPDNLCGVPANHAATELSGCDVGAVSLMLYDLNHGLVRRSYTATVLELTVKVYCY